MSLNQTRTMQVFEKTYIRTSQPTITCTNSFVQPRQPSCDAKKITIDYKKVNPLLMG
jgi:hypothetical protein